MSYIINKFNGEELVVLEDGTINTSTSLGLVGRNYVGYGETQNENFVFLLENFANDFAPSRPVTGQTWFSTDTNLFHVYDGTQWSVIGNATKSDTAPVSPSEGSLWIKTPINQLFVYTNGSWRFIGPEDVEGFGGPTRARSTTLLDDTGTRRPVILLSVAGTVIAIVSSLAFTIAPSESISGFNLLSAGLTLSDLTKVKGTLEGVADRAIRLENARLINGVNFDGTANITIKSNTTNPLIKGDYIVGSNFDGSSSVTWSIDASSSNSIGKIVARNSTGGFSAGMITADLTGDVIGNVTATTGTSTFNTIQANEVIGPVLTGNASTATKLKTARQINGVNFDGTVNITVPASAQTLTGTYISGSVINSGLKTVGVLNSLTVADAGIGVGASSQLKFLIDTAIPTIRSTTGRLNFDLGVLGPDINFVNASTSLGLGGPNAPAIIGDNSTNLGIIGYKFDKIYANELKGNADTATLATTSTNIAGGGAGSMPYQNGIGSTGMIPAGTIGQVLFSQGSSQPIWTSPTSTNTANRLVIRDSSGNFSAGTVTANLVGNVTGNADTVTNGVYTTGSYANPSWLTSLAGSKVTGIPNSSLVNSTITLNGTPVALGGSATVGGGFGVGQSWVDVSSSRTYGTTYTNTTANTIYVSMTFYTPDSDGDDPYQYALGYVNGVEVDRQMWTAGQGCPVWISLHFFVPPGSTYRCDFISPDEGGVNNVSFGLSIQRWSEFR